jgi:hypothetical protein
MDLQQQPKVSPQYFVCLVDGQAPKILRLEQCCTLTRLITIISDEFAPFQFERVQGAPFRGGGTSADTLKAFLVGDEQVSMLISTHTGYSASSEHQRRTNKAWKWCCRNSIMPPTPGSLVVLYIEYSMARGWISGFDDVECGQLIASLSDETSPTLDVRRNRDHTADLLDSVPPDVLDEIMMEGNERPRDERRYSDWGAAYDLYAELHDEGSLDKMSRDLRLMPKFRAARVQHSFTSLDGSSDVHKRQPGSLESTAEDSQSEDATIAAPAPKRQAMACSVSLSFAI